MRIVCVAILVLVLVSAPAIAVDGTSGEVDVVMRVVGESQPSLLGAFTVNAHIEFSGDSARITEKVSSASAEGSQEIAGLVDFLAGMELTTILDGASRTAYVLDPRTKTAMRLASVDVNFPRAGGVGNPLEVLNPEAYPGETTIKRAGKGKLHGKTYDRYVITYQVGMVRGTVDVLVDKNGLPAYLEGKMAGQRFTAEFLNYRFHPISPERFRVPPDYQIVDLSEVANQVEDRLVKSLEEN